VGDGARIAWRSVGVGEPLLLISGQAVDSTDDARAGLDAAGIDQAL
jgi:hypothetical protein